MGNSKSKYCIHVQIQEDVPYPLTNLGALKFLSHQKRKYLFYFLIYIFFIILIQKSRCSMHSTHHANRKILLQICKDMTFFNR